MYYKTGSGNIHLLRGFDHCFRLLHIYLNWAEIDLGWLHNSVCLGPLSLYKGKKAQKRVMHAKVCYIWVPWKWIGSIKGAFPLISPLNMHQLMYHKASTQTALLPRENTSCYMPPCWPPQNSEEKTSVCLSLTIGILGSLYLGSIRYGSHILPCAYDITEPSLPWHSQSMLYFWHLCNF